VNDGFQCHIGVIPQAQQRLKRVSATSRRSAGEVRNRRGRTTGNPGKFMASV